MIWRWIITANLWMTQLHIAMLRYQVAAVPEAYHLADRIAELESEVIRYELELRYS